MQIITLINNFFKLAKIFIKKYHTSQINNHKKAVNESIKNKDQKELHKALDDVLGGKNEA